METLIRLLACQQCKTIEEIPDFDGPAEYDHLLNNIVERHKSNGTAHIGALFKVEEKKWTDTNVRRDVTAQISNKLAGGETGLGHEFYDTKNTFMDDAATCWKQHLRNPACNEYKSESKRLTPGTAAERKAAGLSTYRSAQDRYLCEFCPVNSLVEQARNAKKN